MKVQQLQRNCYWRKALAKDQGLKREGTFISLHLSHSSNLSEEVIISKEGGQYNDKTLGVSINVPEGAEKDQLIMKVGMALYGPFSFLPK